MTEHLCVYVPLCLAAIFFCINKSPIFYDSLNKNSILICCHALGRQICIESHKKNQGSINISLTGALDSISLSRSFPSTFIFNDGNVSFTRKMGKIWAIKYEQKMQIKCWNICKWKRETLFMFNLYDAGQFDVHFIEIRCFFFFKINLN